MINYKKYEEERLELLNKKIKENFENKKDFYKLLNTTERTFLKGLCEGNLYLDKLYKTQELLKLTKEERTFLFFTETLEEQNKFLIPEETIEKQSKEVKDFLRATNKILEHKSIEAREIFLKDLQKSIEKWKMQ